MKIHGTRPPRPESTFCKSTSRDFTGRRPENLPVRSGACHGNIPRATTEANHPVRAVAFVCSPVPFENQASRVVLPPPKLLGLGIGAIGRWLTAQAISRQVKGQQQIIPKCEHAHILVAAKNRHVAACRLLSSEIVNKAKRTVLRIAPKPLLVHARKGDQAAVRRNIRRVDLSFAV